MNLWLVLRAWWLRALKKPLALTFRSFPDPDAPKAWSEEALHRAAVLDAWDARARETKRGKRP